MAASISNTWGRVFIRAPVFHITPQKNQTFGIVCLRNQFRGGNVMKHALILSAATVGLMLSGCGDSSNSNTTEKAAEKPAAEAPTEKSAAMDTVKEVAKDVAAKAAETLKLDTSSLESFKASVANMKASLSDEQQAQLTDALKSLAKEEMSDVGSLAGAAAGLATGKDTTEVVYDKLKDKLSGLSFEEVLALAK